MKFNIMTLFPEMVENYFKFSILKRAIDAGVIEISTTNPRDYTENKHKKVDDTPYGGGAGMVLMPQPYVDCYENITKMRRSVTVMMTPQGEPYTDKMSNELAEFKQIIILGNFSDSKFCANSIVSNSFFTTILYSIISPNSL